MVIFLRHKGWRGFQGSIGPVSFEGLKAHKCKSYTIPHCEHNMHLPKPVKSPVITFPEHSFSQNTVLYPLKPQTTKHRLITQGWRYKRALVILSDEELERFP